MSINHMILYTHTQHTMTATYVSASVSSTGL